MCVIEYCSFNIELFIAAYIKINLNTEINNNLSLAIKLNSQSNTSEL
jgi:hypothetical protein